MKLTREALSLTLMALLGTTRSKMVEVDARIKPKIMTTSLSLVEDDLDVI